MPQVLRVRPTCWERLVQLLEITSGELLPDQKIPQLTSRRELGRAEALKLWVEKRQAGWAPCNPQWCSPRPPRAIHPHQAESRNDGHLLADEQQPPATAIPPGGSPRPAPP
ncbi:DUF1651 domain-containing protein [Cyanobium gracile]|uniref:DUF1651 domain-containing protein n=1 Tax=Cyanobium gracile TaxID=59930 RepID=UPI001FDFB30F|nr:DUF1651 domain-containing protein [Cyanobium gracile]